MFAAMDRGELTRMLEEARSGRTEAFDSAYALLYDELQGLAHRVRGGRAGETLNTTALVHEAYAKLLPSAHHDWQGRQHFLRVAARAMRQVLMDAARRKGADKRAGAVVTLNEELAADPVTRADLLALDEALERLGQLDPRQVQIVECRYFAGMSVEETAQALDVSERTVKRDWAAARAWLARELKTKGGR